MRSDRGGGGAAVAARREEVEKTRRDSGNGACGLRLGRLDLSIVVTGIKLLLRSDNDRRVDDGVCLVCTL
jgi:hypothetical protein